MADPTPVRRSARGRVPNKKYSIDAFEIAEISKLFSSESEAEDKPLPKLDTSDDEDFQSEAAAAEESEAEDDLGGVSDNVSDGSAIETPEEELEDALSYASCEEQLDLDRESGLMEHSYSRMKLSVHQGAKRNPSKNFHSRGMPGSERSGSKDTVIMFMAGTDPEDLMKFLWARDRWAHDATLPTSRAFRGVIGGMRLSYHTSEEQRSAEATVGWDWYYKTKGKEAVSKSQKISTLSPAQALKYLPRSHANQSFLMGPYDNQAMFHLALWEVATNQKLWSTTKHQELETTAKNRSRKPKTGCMLNAGAKVQCIDWAPSHLGNTQYLAISTVRYPPITIQPHSAFQPSEPYPSCIQLWKFNVHENADDACEVRQENFKPVSILCTNWGVPKYFRWCPAPREVRDEDEEERIFVGLLAGIWSDGYVRVLDVQIDKEQISSPVYVHYEGAAFESRPPNTICTCLTWLSGTELAVGCANGFIAIWDIASCILATNQGQSPSALETDSGPDTTRASNSILYPYFYHSLHQSYVLSVTSTYPSHRNFLVSASVDGYLRLTDLRNPMCDFVHSPRSRNLSPAVDYHFALQSFISPDDNDFLRALPLRRFYSVLTFAKAAGQVISVAAGKVHASVLVGSADGSVMVTNPMRKVLNTKETQFQQTWFKHEWVHRPSAKDNGGIDIRAEEATEDSSDRGKLPRKGISRITEGYKVESLQVLKSGKGKLKLKDASPYSTIHEEESGVTQVAWNPNLDCGGWAAAGVGCGLVRVENLAI